MTNINQISAAPKSFNIKKRLILQQLRFPTVKNEALLRTRSGCQYLHVAGAGSIPGPDNKRGDGKGSRSIEGDDHI